MNMRSRTISKSYREQALNGDLVRKAQKDQLEELYDKLVDDYSSQAKSYLADRDGDLYRIKCPKCRIRVVAPISGQLFVCEKKHVFSLYPEDGIREETDENKNRILGDDLSGGTDAHDHAPYSYHDPNESELIYLSCWPDSENEMTLEKAASLSQKLYDRLDGLNKRLNFPKGWYSPTDFHVEIMMSGGKLKPVDLWDRVKTWPKNVRNNVWFVLSHDLKDTEWNVNIFKLDR